jgi:hypothetical protein
MASSAPTDREGTPDCEERWGGFGGARARARPGCVAELPAPIGARGNRGKQHGDRGTGGSARGHGPLRSGERPRGTRAAAGPRGPACPRCRRVTRRAEPRGRPQAINVTLVPAVGGRAETCRRRDSRTALPVAGSRAPALAAPLGASRSTGRACQRERDDHPRPTRWSPARCAVTQSVSAVCGPRGALAHSRHGLVARSRRTAWSRGRRGGGDPRGRAWHCGGPGRSGRNGRVHRAQ